MTFPSVPLSEIVKPVMRNVAVTPGVLYRTIGVKWWGEGAYERQTIDGAQTAAKALSVVRAGDLIINKIWVRHGSVAIASFTVEGCAASGEFPTFELNRDLVFPGWIHWQTKTRDFWSKCDSLSRGTSGKNRIKPELFLTIEVPLPPLPDQRRIVARIEALSAKIEEARGLREQTLEEVEALKSSAVSNLSGLKKWQTKTVGEIVGADALCNGKSVKAFGESGEIRCLVLSSMRNGRINVQDSKAVPLTLKQAKPFLVRKRDVFVMRGNGSKHLCGQAGLAEEETERIVFPDLFIRIPLPESEVLAEYFVAVWNSGPVRSVIEEKAKTTSGIWKVNQGHISSTLIPVPPLPEQRRIVAYLNNLQAKVDALKKLQAETADELAALLPSVLDKAFKGEL